MSIDFMFMYFCFILLITQFLNYKNSIWLADSS